MESALLLPPFTAGLERLRSFYRLEFLSDGFPGRREDDGSITPHPIYGTYVLLDYAKQYARNPTTQLRDALRVVAHAAVRRMEPIEDALAFYYEPDEHPVTRQPERHYSGLTQAYYAVALYRAYRATADEKLRDAAAATLRSLAVPAQRGGVMYSWSGGVAVAEVPTSPRDLILNGWLSILQSVAEYAELSGDPDAERLFRSSAETLASLLPLYDVPELANSRYGLTGPLYLRVKFGARTDNLHLHDLHLAIRNEGELPIQMEAGIGRWANRLTHPDDDLIGDPGPSARVRRAALRMNVVISMLSHPEPNRLMLELEGTGPMPLALWASTGSYSPHTSAPVDRHWIEVTTSSTPAGRHRVELDIPWHLVHLAAYPTNFIKKIDGQPTNVYHMIHIKRLREIHRRLDIEALSTWANRWEDYAVSWDSLPLYRGLQVRNYFPDIPATSIDLATYRRRVLRDRPAAP